MTPSLSLWLGGRSKRTPESIEILSRTNQVHLIFSQLHTNLCLEGIQDTQSKIQRKDIRVRTDGNAIRLQVRTRSHAKRRGDEQGPAARASFPLGIIRYGPHAVTSFPVPFSRHVVRVLHLAVPNRIW